MTEQQFIGNQDMFEQARLQTKIFNLQKQLSISVTGSEQFYRTQNEILKSNEALARLQQQGKSRSTPVQQGLFDSSAVTIAHVQKSILKDHKALVELFEGDSAVYIMVITQKKARLGKIDKADFNSTLKQYLDYISSTSLLNRDLSGYCRVARHLHDLLFAGERLPEGRIIVSPGGRYFPFETLITGNSKSPDYFVYRYAVSYTYSARYLLILNQYNHKPAAGTRTLLGMAPVSYKYDATLPDLTESDRSVRRVQAYFGDADTMLYAAATKANFLNNFYRYKINYLSTHATDSGSMGEPVIYFADEPMSLSELVAGKRPETELVIASACKTGLGKVYRGEGVYNFSRGFASVGIPACVINLWSVEESAANRLTELFCSYIAENEPTDVAMQKAKLEFLRTAKERQRLPYYWAASVLAGKTGIIDCRQPFAWGRTLSLLFPLALATGVVLMIRLRRKPAVK